MDIRATALPEVKVLTPRRIGDARGFFCETWNAARMAASGLDLAFVQDNEGHSARAGTLRGLHYQAPPFA
jgi:dTDP-4-dehydrorhamnose 3,5-epimerase